MKYIDIHCHLDREDYGSDFDLVLVRMKNEGVGAISIGACLEESEKVVKIANENKEIWACVGIHPEYIGTEKGVFEEQKFEELLKNPKVIGIGECGLEYFNINDENIKELQKKLFERQIEFSIKHDKPLMLHIRASKNSFDAYENTLEILKNYPNAHGNVHFFAGNTEIAKSFLDLGFTMSFTGVITFTHDYDEVIKYIPQDMIMSETDAPFVAPVPHRGQRNEPVFVIEVVKKLAEIRGEDFEALNNAILENAKRVFGLAFSKIM